MVFDKLLRIKNSDIKELCFDCSMPSLSNASKTHYVSSLYMFIECTCERLSKILDHFSK